MLNKGQKIKLLVHDKHAGLSLAEYIKAHQHWFAGINTEEALAQGMFSMDQKTLGPSHILTAGCFTFFRRPWREPDAPNEIPVLFEDEHLLVIDKPEGYPVTPSGRFYEHSLLHLLRTRHGNTDLSPMHRLDLETSGVLMWAKTAEARSFYPRQFQEKLVDKRYEALVYGHLDPNLREINFPLQRHEQIYTRFVPCTRFEPAAKAKTALTEILNTTHLNPKAQAVSSVTLRPITGRTNQIRAHLAGVGHAIVGDKKYHPDTEVFLNWLQHRSFQELAPVLLLPNQALHCAALSLRGPAGEEQRFVSPRDVYAGWLRSLPQS